MVKKSSLIIAVALIILLIGGIIMYTQVFNTKHVEVEGTNFKVPNGFHVGAFNEELGTNLTNGSSSIFINKLNDTTLEKAVDDYDNYKINQSYKTLVSNYMVNDVLVYKMSLVNDSSNVHYWFNYNDDVYCIYSFNHISKLDYIVSELINSAV